MLRFSDIVLGTGGEVRCHRCHGPATEAFRGIDAIKSDIERVSRPWSQGPGPNLALIGAEPFRHPAIADVLESALTAGAQRIRVESDAAALQTPEAVGSALKSGVRHLRITLLGSTEALHDALAQATGSFGATLLGAASFARGAKEASLPVHVTARVPVCQHNLRDLPAIVDAASRAGVCTVLLAVTDGGIDARSAAPWLEAACDTGVVHATWVEVEGFPDALAVGWELHLASAYSRPDQVGAHA